MLVIWDAIALIMISLQWWWVAYNQIHNGCHTNRMPHKCWIVRLIKRVYLLAKEIIPLQEILHGVIGYMKLLSHMKQFLGLYLKNKYVGETSYFDTSGQWVLESHNLSIRGANGDKGYIRCGKCFLMLSPNMISDSSITGNAWMRNQHCNYWCSVLYPIP